MKLINWISWLLAVGLCLAEARYRMRRPMIPLPPPPPSHLLKKPWPIASRISMGNNLHIGGGFPHKRMSYKPPPNHRIRRPPSMFNVLQTTWKSHIPMLSTMNNHAVLPQHPPVKDFYNPNRASEYSPEYIPEYRLETSQLTATHRRDIDDDKGPIHTIPAPNLSPADKPYTPESNVPVPNSEKSISNPQRQSPANDIPHYNTIYQINPLSNIGFGILSTTLAPHRTILTSSTQTPHQYEVTETNEINHTVQPNYVVPEIDVTRVADLINSDLQGNEVFLNHPTGPSLIQSNLGTVGTNVQFGQTNVPMQTNLHVRFPGTAIAQAPYEIDPRIPNFQDFIQQQQLAELLQPNVLTTFSQPQMQSFNYDEQANKQQQQQQQQQQKHILVGQNYASGKVTADYNLESETTDDESSNRNESSNDQLDFIPDGTEQSDNNIEFEETNNQRGETTYFNKVTNNGGAISSKFYTTLPSREAAEKLAALAAAGNVNSQLIEQLRKQQQQQQQQDQPQDNEPIPANHKIGEDYQMSDEEQEQNRYDRQQQQYDQQQQQQQQYDQQREQLEEYEQRQMYNQQQKYDQYDEQEQYQPQYQEEENKKYPENQSTRISGHTQQRFSEKKRNQSQENENKRVIKILVPNADQYNDEVNQGNITKDNGSDIEYDYIDDKNVEDAKTMNSSEEKTSHNHSSTKFGTRLNTKTSNQNHQ